MTECKNKRRPTENKLKECNTGRVLNQLSNHDSEDVGLPAVWCSCGLVKCSMVLSETISQTGK